MTMTIAERKDVRRSCREALAADYFKPFSVDLPLREYEDYGPGIERVPRIEVNSYEETEHARDVAYDEYLMLLAYLEERVLVKGHNTVVQCAWCKRVATGEEEYEDLGITTSVQGTDDFQVSHGICPDCCKEEMERCKTQPHGW